MYKYRTSGVCAGSISFDITEDEKVTGVSFNGGCNGNLKGIVALSKGQKISDVKNRLSGITCGGKNTSCPDQLAKALKSIQ